MMRLPERRLRLTVSAHGTRTSSPRSTWPTPEQVAKKKTIQAEIDRLSAQLKIETRLSRWHKPSGSVRRDSCRRRRGTC